MGHIAILPKIVADKIAAGEVVERPASVVKELLENSLDAGATAIEVMIEDAGRAAIVVSDNGSGMSQTDAAACSLRHATSKIHAATDLDAITTLGFRGEALASIAAVSRLSITTNDSDSSGGWQVTVEPGGAPLLKPATRQRGTTVRVRNLFCNTPARLKFLKSKSTEMFHITRTVTELALAYPQVSFLLTANRKEIIRVAGSSELRQRIVLLLGKELKEALMPVSFSMLPLQINGFIARPGQGRSQRSSQYVFVNKRPITDRTINHAIMQGYHTFIMEKQFPPLVLSIDTPPEFVDVNVHPNKREIRFREGTVVHDVLVTMIQRALGAGTHVSGQEADNTRAAEGIRASAQEPRLPSLLPGRQQAKAYAGKALDNFLAEDTAASFFDQIREEDNPTSRSMAAVGSYLLLDNTYIILRDEKGMRIIDQHAAHERIVFNELRAQFHTHRVERQQLLLPVVIELDKAHYDLGMAFQEVFDKLGFGIESFGSTSIAVHSYPALLGDVNIKEVFHAILADMLEFEHTQAVTEQMDDIISSIACHAAVRAHDKLSVPQVAALLERLARMKDSATCPHGRPVEFILTRQEIEKRLRRT